MQVAILAGGRGSRLEALGRPKALAQIGQRSILAHVIDRYIASGMTDIWVALGFRAELVAAELPRDFPGWTARDRGYGTELSRADGSPGRITLVDTGVDETTGSRLLQLRPLLSDRTFSLSWTDALSDIDFAAMVTAHRGTGATLTIAAVRPPARFGRLTVDPDDRITAMAEKDRAAEPWINAGHFVVEPAFLDAVAADGGPLETGAIAAVIEAGESHAYRHAGFWQCMDYPHEHRLLDELWASGNAPWVSGKPARQIA
ncbi:MAG: sugar phosphate nucleotidyltransferase [Pseudomonadota bacterium]